MQGRGKQVRGGDQKRAQLCAGGEAHHLLEGLCLGGVVGGPPCSAGAPSATPSLSTSI